MFVQIICVVLFASSACVMLACLNVSKKNVLSRNVPNFRDLDEEEKMLFRAAYDSYDAPYNHETPSYNLDTPSYSYESYDNEIPLGKLDLLKDGMWALKAKLKEIKAFNKALAANLLLTKLQVKDLMAHHLKPLKNHQHVELNKKPVYSYQPSSPASYPEYEQKYPQNAAPAPTSNHNAPASQYTAQHYGAPPPVHDPYYGH